MSSAGGKSDLYFCIAVYFQCVDVQCCALCGEFVENVSCVQKEKIAQGQSRTTDLVITNDVL